MKRRETGMRERERSGGRQGSGQKERANLKV